MQSNAIARYVLGPMSAAPGRLSHSQVGYFTETVGWIELVYGSEATLGLLYIAL